MSLRNSPTRTPALLSANLANARLCTGPRTAAGKARSSLNSLKHGRYAHDVLQKLRAAGDKRGIALYARIREQIVSVFRIADSQNLARANRFAITVYAMARQSGVLETKPECPSLDVTYGPRSYSHARFRVCDPWNRLGVVFWVQRKGFWTHKKIFDLLFRHKEIKEPPLRRMLERRIRLRVYRMRRLKSSEQAELNRMRRESSMRR